MIIIGISSETLALDLACGSGQATIPLADYYSKVIGTDIAKEQISEAPQHPKISFNVGTAEDIAQVDNSVDLVTVAQAFHWFDFTKSFTEIRRVLKKPGGVCAVWTYGNPTFSNPVINKKINEDFYLHLLDGYWSNRRNHVDNEYREIEVEMRKYFDLCEAVRSGLTIDKQMTIHDFVRYLSSWSAYTSYRQKNPNSPDPLEKIEKELVEDYQAISSSQIIDVSWPIYLLLGGITK